MDLSGIEGCLSDVAAGRCLLCPAARRARPEKGGRIRPNIISIAYAAGFLKRSGKKLRPPAEKSPSAGGMHGGLEPPAASAASSLPVGRVKAVEQLIEEVDLPVV